MDGDPTILDRELDRYRQRIGSAPPGVTNAATMTFRRRQAARPTTTMRVGRALLVLAGLTGLGLSGIGLAGAGFADALRDLHPGKDMLGLQAALAVGWLIAAWRPLQYRTGLLPVSVVAAVVLTLLSASTATAGPSATVVEASHIPVLVGTAGLWLAGPLSFGSRRHQPMAA